MVTLLVFVIMPGRVKFIQGNFFDLENDYFLVHQCNCVSTKGKGLSRNMSLIFPGANVFASEQQRIPGTIFIKQRVVNMMVQVYPGRSKFPTDTVDIRLQFFKMCLKEITNHPIHKIAFPFRWGCGLAGSDWRKYLELIHHFAVNHPARQVVIVKAENQRKIYKCT